MGEAKTVSDITDPTVLKEIEKIEERFSKDYIHFTFEDGKTFRIPVLLIARDREDIRK